MKFFRNVFWLWILAAIALAGCCTALNQNDPVAQYRHKHSVEAKKYSLLDPTNLEACKGMVGLCMGSWSFFGPELKRQFGNVPGINMFADKEIEVQGSLMNSLLKMFLELKDASSGGGAVCQFEWSDGTTKETGLLALKSGEIVKREVFITDYLKGKPFSVKGGNE
jgi:hypothetical protein